MRPRNRLSARRNSPLLPVSCGSSSSRQVPSISTPMARLPSADARPNASKAAAFFRRSIEAALADRTVPSDRSPGDLSRLLLGVLLGIRCPCPLKAGASFARRRRKAPTRSTRSLPGQGQDQAGTRSRTREIEGGQASHEPQYFRGRDAEDYVLARRRRDACRGPILKALGVCLVEPDQATERELVPALRLRPGAAGPLVLCSSTRQGFAVQSPTGICKREVRGCHFAG